MIGSADERIEQLGENADRYERIAQMTYDPAHSEAGGSFRENDGPRLSDLALLLRG